MGKQEEKGGQTGGKGWANRSKRVGKQLENGVKTGGKGWANRRKRE